ncbi:rCG43197, partial [Rattus norvegicus]
DFRSFPLQTDQTTVVKDLFPACLSSDLGFG